MFDRPTQEKDQNDCNAVYVPAEVLWCPLMQPPSQQEVQFGAFSNYVF